MIGLIAFIVSVSCCAIYVNWSEGDDNVNAFRDDWFFWFAPAASIIGIVIAWVAYGMKLEWAMGLWPSIIWTVVLFFSACGTLLLNCFGYSEDDQEEYEDWEHLEPEAEID